MSLRVGDVVEKKRGGGTRKARVARLFCSDAGEHTHRFAELLPLAKTGSRSVVRLDLDGMPEGYRKAVKT